MASPDPATRRFEDIDWSVWQPVDRATLLFVRRGDEILLIHKKRGLGAGKINGPGGRLEPGETPAQAAVREVQEELCVTPSGLEARGELKFQFVDGYSIHGYVFSATHIDGEPCETDEAIPFWQPVNDLPYDRMWADDALWMPLMLDGILFEGCFLFDGDTMLGYHLDHETGN